MMTVVIETETSKSGMANSWSFPRAASCQSCSFISHLLPIQYFLLIMFFSLSLRSVNIISQSPHYRPDYHHFNILFMVLSVLGADLLNYLAYMPYLLAIGLRIYFELRSGC